VLGQRACLRPAVVPNKGGRGIERLRSFWLPTKRRPAYKVPRATSIWRRLQGIARRASRSHSVLLVQPCPATSLISSHRERPPTDIILLSDGVLQHCANINRWSLTEPKLCAESGLLHRHLWQWCGQQIASRLENDCCGIWVPGPACHPCLPCASRTGDELAYLFRIRCAPCAMFETTKLPRLKLALQLPSYCQRGCLHSHIA
jgi:hypothetical protein